MKIYITPTIHIVNAKSGLLLVSHCSFTREEHEWEDYEAKSRSTSFYNSYNDY